MNKKKRTDASSGQRVRTRQFVVQRSRQTQKPIWQADHLLAYILSFIYDDQRNAMECFRSARIRGNVQTKVLAIACGIKNVSLDAQETALKILHSLRTPSLEELSSSLPRRYYARKTCPIAAPRESPFSVAYAAAADGSSTSSLSSSSTTIPEAAKVKCVDVYPRRANGKLTQTPSSKDAYKFLVTRAAQHNLHQLITRIHQRVETTSSVYKLHALASSAVLYGNALFQCEFRRAVGEDLLCISPSVLARLLGLYLECFQRDKYKINDKHAHDCKKTYRQELKNGLAVLMEHARALMDQHSTTAAEIKAEMERIGFFDGSALPSPPSAAAAASSLESLIANGFQWSSFGNTVNQYTWISLARQSNSFVHLLGCDCLIGALQDLNVPSEMLALFLKEVWLDLCYTGNIDAAAFKYIIRNHLAALQSNTPATEAITNVVMFERASRSDEWPTTIQILLELGISPANSAGSVLRDFITHASSDDHDTDVKFDEAMRNTLKALWDHGARVAEAPHATFKCAFDRCHTATFAAVLDLCDKEGLFKSEAEQPRGDSSAPAPVPALTTMDHGDHMRKILFNTDGVSREFAQLYWDRLIDAKTKAQLASPDNPKDVLNLWGDKQLNSVTVTYLTRLFEDIHGEPNRAWRVPWMHKHGLLRALPNGALECLPYVCQVAEHVPILFANGVTARHVSSRMPQSLRMYSVSAVNHSDTATSHHVSAQRYDVAMALVKHGASLKEDGWVLSRALSNGAFSIAEWLVKNGAPVRYMGSHSLATLILANQPFLLECVLTRVSDPMRGKNFRTAVATARALRHNECLDVLRKHGLIDTKKAAKASSEAGSDSESDSD